MVVVLASVILLRLWECRFHPMCVNLTPEQVKKLENFICSDCATEEEENKRITSNGRNASPEAKVGDFSDPNKIIIVYFSFYKHYIVNSHLSCLNKWHSVEYRKNAARKAKVIS